MKDLHVTASASLRYCGFDTRKDSSCVVSPLRRRDASQEAAGRWPGCWYEQHALDPTVPERQNVEVPRPPIKDVPLTEEPIRVGQFLKLAGLAEHGAHAKELLDAGEVHVNGRLETRRGARLRIGDVVAVHRRRARPGGPPSG